MLKKGILLIMLGLIFSSCQEIAIIKYSIDDAIQQAKIREITNPYYGKDGAWSYQTNKEVLNIVKEVLKRPINKEIQFDGIKIMIPEDTRINPQKGAIVDVKTGYGLPLSINYKTTCPSAVLEEEYKGLKLLSGSVKDNKYMYIYTYNVNNSDLDKLVNKIKEKNGFTHNCVDGKFE